MRVNDNGKSHNVYSAIEQSRVDALPDAPVGAHDGSDPSVSSNAAGSTSGKATEEALIHALSVACDPALAPRIESARRDGVAAHLARKGNLSVWLTPDGYHLAVTPFRESPPMPTAIVRLRLPNAPPLSEGVVAMMAPRGDGQDDEVDPDRPSSQSNLARRLRSDLAASIIALHRLLGRHPQDAASANGLPPAPMAMNATPFGEPLSPDAPFESTDPVTLQTIAAAPVDCTPAAVMPRGEKRSTLPLSGLNAIFAPVEGGPRNVFELRGQLSVENVGPLLEMQKTRLGGRPRLEYPTIEDATAQGLVPPPKQPAKLSFEPCLPLEEVQGPAQRFMNRLLSNELLRHALWRLWKIDDLGVIETGMRISTTSVDHQRRNFWTDEQLATFATDLGRALKEVVSSMGTATMNSLVLAALAEPDLGLRPEVQADLAEHVGRFHRNLEEAGEDDAAVSALVELRDTVSNRLDMLLNRDPDYAVRRDRANATQFTQKPLVDWIMDAIVQSYLPTSMPSHTTFAELSYRRHIGDAIVPDPAAPSGHRINAAKLDNGHYRLLADLEMKALEQMEWNAAQLPAAFSPFRTGVPGPGFDYVTVLSPGAYVRTIDYLGAGGYLAIPAGTELSPELLLWLELAVSHTPARFTGAGRPPEDGYLLFRTYDGLKFTREFLPYLAGQIGFDVERPREHGDLRTLFPLPESDGWTPETMLRRYDIGLNAVLTTGIQAHLIPFTPLPGPAIGAQIAGVEVGQNIKVYRRVLPEEHWKAADQIKAAIDSNAIPPATLTEALTMDAGRPAEVRSVLIEPGPDEPPGATGPAVGQG